MIDRRGFRITYMITAEGSLGLVAESILTATALGVDLVQIRQKKQPTARLESWLSDLLAAHPRLRERLLLNARWDLAIALGIRGVHLPESGLPIAVVRRASPSGFLIGSSTHSLAGAQAAERAGADFIVFGPVFETTSKLSILGVGVEALAEVASRVGIPVLALGGVSPRNIRSLASSGARGVSGISMFQTESSSRAVIQTMNELGASGGGAP